MRVLTILFSAGFVLGLSSVASATVLRVPSEYPTIQAAIDASPEEADLWYDLGMLLDRMGRVDDAIDAFRRVIELDPGVASAYNYIGYSCAERGINLAESVEMTEKALELDPQNGFFIDSLGWAYFRQGRLEEAVVELERAAQLVEDPIVHEHLGDVHYADGAVEDARRHWERSLELDPENREVREKLQRIGFTQE
jgi:Flp pilus assembly protein TadD